MMQSTELALAPKQERAAFMLATGIPVQSVAQELGVHRSTLWQWRRHETFQAVYNALVAEAQGGLREGLLSLSSDAIQALREAMKSGNDATRLRAAIYVLDKVEKLESGPIDPRDIVRQNCTTTEHDALLKCLDRFDARAYQVRCEELGIMI